jgi:hypothetical protein
MATELSTSVGWSETDLWEMMTRIPDGAAIQKLCVCWREPASHKRNQFYMLRNQFATALGSNLTHVPIRKQGMRPTFASLKTVMRDTDSNSASSTAVRA